MRSEPSQRLAGKALPVWRIHAALNSLFLLLVPIAYGILRIFISLPLWVLIALIACYLIYVIIFVIVVPPIRWRRWRYEVREHDIELQHGVFIVKRTLIPMTRVQHVDTEQGPILRKYKLAVVSISTAATVHRIPSLSIDVADELRNRIAQLAAVAEDE